MVAPRSKPGHFLVETREPSPRSSWPYRHRVFKSREAATAAADAFWVSISKLDGIPRGPAYSDPAIRDAHRPIPEELAS